MRFRDLSGTLLDSGHGPGPQRRHQSVRASPGAAGAGRASDPSERGPAPRLASPTEQVVVEAPGLRVSSAVHAEDVYLQRAGHDVVIRADGRSGLDRALGDPPDLVILDVMRPGLDGFEVCRALRSVEATRDLPVIFLSARSDLGDRVAGLDQGAVDYLVKPFEPDELLARVRAALRTKRLQDDLRRANAELRAADQNRQELVSMLAHDIRGMLGAVSSAVELARADREALPSRDAHRFLGIAERNTTELVDLATNLLDCYRLDEGRIRPGSGRSIWRPSPRTWSIGWPARRSIARCGWWWSAIRSNGRSATATSWAASC